MNNDNDFLKTSVIKQLIFSISNLKEATFLPVSNNRSCYKKFDMRQQHQKAEKFTAERSNARFLIVH